MTQKSGQIRIGIGGWTFAPWRGTFYPKVMPQPVDCEKSADFKGPARAQSECSR
jgi:hypothetical protein